MKLIETMHNKQCKYLDAGRAACNCQTREEWLKLRNDWDDYKEWNNTYGHIKNGVATEPKPNLLGVYAAVPFWPITLATLFIKGGADKIPDFREIERLEEITGLDYKELNS